jgi:hypothetical protein
MICLLYCVTQLLFNKKLKDKQLFLTFTKEYLMNNYQAQNFIEKYYSSLLELC